MTKVIIRSDDAWAKKRILSMLDKEKTLFRNVIRRTENKLNAFAAKYGEFDRDSLYGKVDDMELLEWEGELEVLKKLNAKLKSFEEITFELE